MKCCIVLMLASFYTVVTPAQNPAIDSLSRLISRSKTDTERIALAAQQVALLSEVNIDSAMMVGKKVIGEARTIGYKQGEADALINIASVFCRKGDYPSAAQSLRDAEIICAPLQDSLRFARVYAAYGMMYGMQAKYDTSIIFYEKAIGIDERFRNIKRLGSGYGNLAIGYQMQSNFPQALIYQQKSLRIAEQQNDLSSEAYTMMNMGNTYQNIGDTLRSENAILKGIELAKRIGIRNVELYGYSNLASLYASLNKWDKSYTFATQAAALAKTMGDAGIQSASISKAALALAKTKRYAEAENLNATAMRTADSSGQTFNIYQVYSTMGTILTLQQKYKEAIPFLEKSIHELKEAEKFEASVAETYAELSACYERTGNYAAALSNFKISAEIVDSARSKENIRKATEQSMNYEFEKKQALTDAIQGKKNAESKLKQLILLVALALTLLLAAGAWLAFRNKQKANAHLREQKTELQSTLTRLKVTQAQLIQSEKMASLGELTAGIAHEIQNPLNFVNNFSELSEELIDEMTEEINKGNIAEVKLIAGSIKNNLDKIYHHGKRADAIVKGMLQHSRINNDVKEPTDINALADEYLRLSYHGLRAKDKSFNTTIETHFDENIGNINVNRQDIGRVLLNLFNNAFYAVSAKRKTANEGYLPVVAVRTRRMDDNIEVTISDNGNGIPARIADKIFQPFFTTKPTGEGTGLGLSLSYDIITKQHNGSIEVENKEGEGVEFIIQIPVTQ